LQIARQSQGELFVSLHADSLVSAPKVSGRIRLHAVGEGL
jgi:N-acetylmuramoyl-L-alanine amidase